jgi:hypothetical protein
MAKRTTKIVTKAAPKAKKAAARKTAARKIRAGAATVKKTARKKATKPVRVRLVETTMQAGVRREEIEKLAYSLFENRGGVHGNDQGDWFEAERIIQSR